jgi:pimeloyl-ACP methyl ester carboxylesterase
MATIDGVEIHIDGGGAETIVMVHGWPDTYRLWDAQVAFLKSRYRCVRFTLPGFDIGKPRRAYSIEEIADFLRRVIEQVSPARKVILMLHDWGCLFGYQFYMRHPELVSRIVGVDIGDTKGLQYGLPRRQILMIMAYQRWLAYAWRIGGRIGDWMSLRMKRLLKSPSDERFIASCMAYPYYQAWFGGYPKAMKRFKPACPVLFIYGKRKPVMFHTQAWLDELRKGRGNSVVEFDTGHWVMLQRPERFNQTVGDWLAATAAA